MATTLFLTDAVSSRSSSSWTNGPAIRTLLTTRGTNNGNFTDNTIAGLANASPGAGGVVGVLAAGATTMTLAAGQTAENIPAGIVWISEPLFAVTIAGNITINPRALESATAANYGIGCVIYKIAVGNGAATKIAQGASTTELGTVEAARSATLTPIASTVLANGDMLAVLPIWCSAGGTSTSGRTANAGWGGSVSGSTGDFFVTFTETVLQAAYFGSEGEEHSDQRSLQIMDRVAPTRSSFFCLGDKWARRRSGILVPT